MSNLNSLLESSNQWKNVQSDAARLASKWDKTGLLEGLENEVEKNNMSLILENQAKQLVVESSQTGGGTASRGNFTPGTGGQWAGVALPMVRKVFGQIASKDFVSVQPMSLPSGLVFFLDFQYGGGGASATDQNGKFPTGSDVFGNSSLYGVTDTTGAPTDGLYGAGKWTYSTNTTESVALTAPVIASASWAETGFDSVLSASVAAGTVKKVTFASTQLAYPDQEGARGFQVSAGTNITVATQYAQYNNFDGTNFDLFVAGTTGTPGTETDVKILYIQQPTDQYRGDFEDANPALNGNNSPEIDIPEINIKMKSEAIVAKTKNLKLYGLLNLLKI